MLRQPIVCVLGHVDHGKCVAPDTMIQMADGRLSKAKELYEEYSKKGAEIAIEDGTVVELQEGPEVFSFDGMKIARRMISHVWKRKAPESLVRVVLASGDKMDVTPEHPFYAKRIESTEGWKQASLLKEGDFVLFAGKLEMPESAITRLKEEIAGKLSLSVSFVVFIDAVAGKDFIGRLSSENLSLLKRKGVLTTNARNCRKKERFRVVDFFRLCNYFGFSQEHAYDMIGHIKNASGKWRAGKTSNKMKLPKTEAEFRSLAYVLGCIQGDGCLSSKRVALHNNDEEIHKEYIQGLKQVFGLEARVVQNHTCKTVINNGGLTLGKFLIEVFGMPYEHKSASINIPDMLLLRNDTAASFIRGWFDTDGYVSHLNNSIEITSKSPHIVRAAAACLLRFGILGVIAEKGGYWTIRIANDPYVKRFLEKISPNCKFKKGRLELAFSKTSTSRIFDMAPIAGASMKKNISVSNEQLPYASRYLQYGCLSRGTIMKMLSQCSSEKTKTELHAFIEDSVRFVKVRSVNHIKPESEFVYDFSVPETKNFIAERTVLHNTSLLDAIRKTSVQKKEAGAITQHIGASEVPKEAISGVCGNALEKMKIELKIPGLLFIDTPGHEAFTNLRERGGSIADIAILVIDINQGIQPQTVESIKILRQFKTPFLIAATKVDAVEGWRSLETKCMAESLKSQNERAISHLDESIYKLIGRISEFGINSERFDRISDFKTQVVIVPASAKTGEGILELLLFLSGLAQKFLEGELAETEGDKAEGSILEVREERGLGTTIDVILYKGTLKKNDTIVFGTAGGGAATKIRAIIKPKPASEITNQQEKYDYPDEVHAACGVKIFAPGLLGALPGSPIVVANTKEEEILEAGKIKEQIGGILFERDEAGIVVKADTLGSLEAVLKMLLAEGIQVRKAGVGNINKKDALDAKVSGTRDSVLGAVLGFGVKDESGAAGQAGKGNGPGTLLGGGEEGGAAVFLDNVVYSLIENYKKWVAECREKEKSDVMAESIYPAKIKSLPGCCFRKSGPAIFGVEVIGGKLLVKSRLMDSKGNLIGSIKGIQKQKESVESAGIREQVAISVEGAFFGKDVFEGSVLYSYIRKGQAEELQKKEGLLSEGDKAILGEILAITETRYI